MCRITDRKHSVFSLILSLIFHGILLFPSTDKNNTALSTYAPIKIKIRHIDKLPISNLNKLSLNDFSVKKSNLKQIKKSKTFSLPNKMISNTNFNIGITPIDETKLDKLNSVDKKFFSFQKRVFKKYIQNFLKSYQNKKILHPQLKDEILRDQFKLFGKLTYDHNGHIVSLKILNKVDKENIQSLFEETLKEINFIPNPPKELLNKKQQFSIYYQLRST
ncbi:MAG: hypothetical protein HOJ35_11540 [Bdellovibrionales bacterium]|jgi:hypothetical protein|nr:hypothetical protein [Bdellovibrionales bacterium]